MHQNLRNSFVLNQETLKDDFKEIKVQEDRLRKMQTLIPAQNYGTFFCLYAKFNGKLKGKGDKTKFHPELCDLFLQNYYGDVTLGLKSLEEEIDVIYDGFVDEPVYLLKVHLRALYACDRFKKPKPTKVKKNPSIRNYESYSKHKEWAKLGGHIDPRYLMRVLFYYDELPKKIFDPEADVNKCAFIDSYKYERDGDELYIKNFEKAGRSEAELLGNNFGEFEILEKSGVIYTFKCRPSYVQFFT